MQNLQLGRHRALLLGNAEVVQLGLQLLDREGRVADALEVGRGGEMEDTCTFVLCIATG